MRNRFQCLVLGLSVLLILAAAGVVAAAAEKGDAMSYADAKEFLAKHTKVVELTGKSGGRVLVCPEWQGRVMTSACAPDGLSFGFINREFIEAGEPNKHINNYGGEDRLWLSPEGGQFSLWFKPGVKADARRLVYAAGVQRRRVESDFLVAPAAIAAQNLLPHDDADGVCKRLGDAFPPRCRPHR